MQVDEGDIDSLTERALHLSRERDIGGGTAVQQYFPSDNDERGNFLGPHCDTYSENLLTFLGWLIPIQCAVAEPAIDNNEVFRGT